MQSGKPSSSYVDHNHGFITEKMYMVLQLFLTNKCKPSIELVNLLSSSDNFNINYLQWVCKQTFECFNFVLIQLISRALATKISLDQQGRLVHRETRKIILPYEHFANAVILKHMAGPGGMHLSMDSTIKSVFESYSCGKNNFGFDRDFIIEVVNSCPSSSCRYYKSQTVPGYEQPTTHQSFPPPQMNMNMDYSAPTRQSPLLMQPPPTLNDPTKLNRSLSNQHLTQQMMQNRAMSQSMESLEKQRVMQQLDKKHFETVAAIVQANNSLGLPSQPMDPTMPQVLHSKSMNYSRLASRFPFDYKLNYNCSF